MSSICVRYNYAHIRPHPYDNAYPNKDSCYIHVNMSNITWNTISTCHYANALPKWHMCVILLGMCINYKLYIYLNLGLSIKYNINVLQHCFQWNIILDMVP